MKSVWKYIASQDILFQENSSQTLLLFFEYTALTRCIRTDGLQQNDVDTDQKPRSVASVQGLHCLPLPSIWHVNIVFEWICKHFRTCIVRN